MAAAPARSERRRPRPGSLERPVSARMYRGTWLLVAVLLLVALGGVGRPRLEIAGDTSRSPAASLVETAAIRIQEQTGSLPARPSALRQLLDLAFPFSLYEQAPFVSRGIPAITLTSGGDRPPAPVGDTPDRLDRIRL